MTYVTKQCNYDLSDLSVPTPEEFIKGYESFRRHETRDAMYKVATFLISHFWGEYREMADALGVLLLTWNQAFYRYGSFDFDKLENCLSKNWKKVEFFRKNKIANYKETDDKNIKEIFMQFLDALQTSQGKSPVAVAKALHLLAPRFFPLWDEEIAKAYKCHYAKHPADKYFSFFIKMQTMAAMLSGYNNIKKDVTILKLIDEYNYAKYTKKWI